MRAPLLYLVDSAGARITDQVEMFPGRRGAGRIFYNQVQMSGQVPQVCLLFGLMLLAEPTSPRSATSSQWWRRGRVAYPAALVWRRWLAGEKVTLEEMGGSKMHCTTSGCGDVLCKTEDQAIAFLPRLPRLHAVSLGGVPALLVGARPPRSGRSIEEVVPADENKSFDMMGVIEAIVDEGSWLGDRWFLREI